MNENMHFISVLKKEVLGVSGFSLFSRRYVHIVHTGRSLLLTLNKVNWR